MATFRPKQRSVSISDLAEMGFCERKAMLKARYGDRDTAVSAKRRKEGTRDHQRFDRQVTAHHNAEVGRDKRCFIATAVYGVSDPRTDELRQFRDEVLAKSRVGRCFVRLYYAASPIAAGWIERRKDVGVVVKRVLDLFRGVIRWCRGGRVP